MEKETKTTKGKLLQAYRVLSQAQLGKCEVKERIEVVKTLRAVRDEVDDIQDFINDVTTKSQDILNQKVESQKVAEINKAIDEEARKEAAHQDTNVLSKDLFDKIVESNPSWTGAAMLLVEDVFVVKG